MEYAQTAVGASLNKPSVLESELVFLSAATEEINSVVATLETRLAGFLREMPKTASGQSTPQDVLTPIPNNIRQNRQATETAISNLRSILSRLEL